MSKKLTTEIFINRANKVHKNFYDYSLVRYEGSHNKVNIICPRHGEFNQIANNHLNGDKCPKCHIEKVSDNTKTFIEKSIKVHGNKYDYSLVEYKNAHKKVKIICKLHGNFEQKPQNHLYKNGCPQCSFNKKCDTKGFVEKANRVHSNKYDYTLVNYINNSTKVKIICRLHGVFEQSPASHTSNKQGCPSCINSKGEIFIEQFLVENKINYIKQHKFPDCKNIRPLSFDFYLPDNNICIEYDGEQHFKPVNRFGGFKSYDKTLIRDKIKNEYCTLNSIKLIRVTSKNLKNLNDLI